MAEQAETPHFPEAFDSGGHIAGDGYVHLPDDSDYRIRLSVFEGPIDLLLYLIRKKELDIHEISISGITKEYLEYVELIKLIDIERAGDFLVVASTLMKIKSRSLFASGDTTGEGAEEESPRDTLIRYLMEYEKLGTVAEKLAEKEEERRNVFPRGGEKERITMFAEENETAPDYMLFDLLSALRDVLKSAPKHDAHEVALLNVTAEQKQREILDALEKTSQIDFIGMVRGQSKIIIVVTFIAMLELIKKRKIRVRQSGQFKRIVIIARTSSEDSDEPADSEDNDAGSDDRNADEKCA